MDAAEIRPPRKEEFHEVVGASNLVFGEEVPPEDGAAFSVGFPLDRALCAYEGGRMAAAQLPPLYGAVRPSHHERAQQRLAVSSFYLYRFSVC